MIETVLAAHSLLIKVFLGFLVGGLLFPMMAKNALAMQKLSFIYTLIFQALITMIAFAGLVAMFMGDFGMSIAIILMFVLFGVMMFIEIKKHKMTKAANLEIPENMKMVKGAFYKISAIQIVLVVGIVVLMVLRAKGIVAI